MRIKVVQPVVLLILANKSLHTTTISHWTWKRTNPHLVSVTSAQTSLASWIFRCMAPQGQETHDKYIKPSEQQSIAMTVTSLLLLLL